MTYLLITLAVLIFLILWLYNRNSGHFRRMQRSRPELPREEYIEMLAQKGYDEELVAVVYDTLRFYLPKWFSMYPGDDIIKFYRISSGDIDLFIRKVVSDNQLSLPPDEEMQLIYEKHNETVTAEYVLDIITNSK